MQCARACVCIHVSVHVSVHVCATLNSCDLNLIETYLVMMSVMSNVSCFNFPTCDSLITIHLLTLNIPPFSLSSLSPFSLSPSDHLLPEEGWTDDNPASCFKTCHCCIPFTRTNSRSSEDIYSDTNRPAKTYHHHRRPGHRRTHSLPKDIEINYQGHPHPCGHVESSITNIYMTCSCKNSPFTPSAPSPFPTTAVWPSTLVPTSTTTTNTISYTNTLARSPVHTAPVSSPDTSAKSPFYTVAVSSSDNSARSPFHTVPVSSPDTSARSPFYTFTASSPTHSCMSTPITTSVTSSYGRQDYPYVLPSASLTSEFDEDGGSSESQLSGELSGARCRHSSYSQGSLNILTSTPLSQSPPQLDNHTAEISGERVNPEGSPVVEGLSSDSNITDDGRGDREMKNETVDMMHNFGCQLFNTPPYNLVQRFYNSNTREAIILIIATFLLYNGLRCVLQTMCEDGGFRKVFTKSESTLNECLRRVAMLFLRILTVVIAPLCFCVHISPIASKPRIPRTGFSQEAAIQRMMSVHRSFSPHYEVSFIQAQPSSVFQMSETMMKRHINSIWLSLVCSLFFAALFSFVGGTKLSAKGFTEGGVCQFLTASIVHLPLVDDVHLLMVLDIILMLCVLISIYLLKDFYYYENRIAVFAVAVGGEGERLYQEIRRRWTILDWYSYITAAAISVGTFALASVKKTIIPDPTTRLQPEHLLNWFFWISILTLLSCLGLSPNRLVKKTSLPAFVLVAFFLKAVNLNIDAIPPESLVVFFLIGGSVLVVSLLLSLSACHYHHWQHTQNRGSLGLFLLSLSLMALLPAAVVGALYRETVHLAAFVQW